MMRYTVTRKSFCVMLRKCFWQHRRGIGRSSPKNWKALRLETSEGWLANVRADLGKVLYYRDVCIADDDHQAAAQWTGHARKYFEMIGHAAEQL